MAMSYIKRLGKETASAPRPCSWKQGRAVSALCDRKYWKRVWIVQESVLAKDIVVLCGQKSVSWQCFLTLHRQLQGAHDFGRMEHIPFAWPVFGSAAMRIISKRAAWTSVPPEARGLPIEEVLEEFADMESTEVKDKVYALLGIIQPFADGSTIAVDYSKSTAGIYREVLRLVTYQREHLDLPGKQRFKKLLKRVLGLGVIGVMERQASTESSIRLHVEEFAEACIKNMETQAVQSYHSRKTVLQSRLPKIIQDTSRYQANLLSQGLWIEHWAARQAVVESSLEPEARVLLTELAERKLNPQMKLAEPALTAELQSHLRDSYEMGVEMVMRWVQDSRFEVESDKDRVIDSVMESRMDQMLQIFLERHAESSIQTAIKAALDTVESSLTAQIRFPLHRMYAEAYAHWRDEYCATWIRKWVRHEIDYQPTDEIRSHIEWWVKDWYLDKAREMQYRLSLKAAAKDHQLRWFRAHGITEDDGTWKKGLRTGMAKIEQIISDDIRELHNETGVWDLSDESARDAEAAILAKVHVFMNVWYPLRQHSPASQNE